MKNYDGGIPINPNPTGPATRDADVEELRRRIQDLDAKTQEPAGEPEYAEKNLVREERERVNGPDRDTTAAHRGLECWSAENARAQEAEERENRILEAGKRAMAYMHSRYGPVPRGGHPETGEPLADQWHERLGLLIDFQTFDPEQGDKPR